MIVHHPDTNQTLETKWSPELSEILRQAFENVCEHPNTEIRNRQITGGSTQVREQCLTCGEAIGQALKKSDYPTAPDFNEKILEQTSRERKLKEWDIVKGYLDSRSRRELEWQKKYDSYLASAEWKSRRDLVFKRCNDICEGCGVNRAEEVHHLHYDNIFEEFLFDLVGVCRKCHERLHLVGTEVADFEDRACRGCRNQGDGVCALFGVGEEMALKKNELCGPKLSGFEPLK